MKSAAKKALIALLCLAAACTPGPQRFDSGFLSMGTTVEVSLLAADATQAASLEQLIEQQLKQEARDWYAFSHDPNSELRQLNAALAQGKPFSASDALLGVLTASLHWHQLSDGYFDPAVAPLVQAWGFADSEPPVNWTPPDESVLLDWQADRPRLSDLHISDHQVSSLRRDLQLDLGAIAKGYALDQAMLTLQAHNTSDALLNLGGQVMIIGERMAQAASQVIVRAPRGTQPLAQLALKAGESLSTSGDYERSREVDGQRLHHLLDPLTGRPVTHTQAVTVIAASGTLADAASTALMAAGPAHWQQLARQMGIRDALRVDAAGRIEVSTALYARLRWVTPKPPSLIVVPL